MRAEFGEPAEQTLKREMREELGVEIEVVRLLWFVENFFAYAGQNYHEIALYFLMRFPTASKYLKPVRNSDAKKSETNRPRMTRMTRIKADHPLSAKPPSSATSASSAVYPS